MSEAGQGITPGGFLALIWTLAAVTTVLFAGRLLIRGILVKSFHLDDVFSGAAWLFMIGAVICSTGSNSLSYHYSSIAVGEIPMPSQEEVSYITVQLRRWSVASQMLFWTSLYSVKLSFMFLYRTVMGTRSRYRLAWNVALVYLVLCYGLCLIGVFAQCGDVKNLFSYEQCMTPEVKAIAPKIIWIAFVFNVTSDLVVIVLPLTVVWRLNMRSKQKLALSAICSLAIITVAFEIVRTVKLLGNDPNLVTVYSYLELIISVLISMLTSYRFLISPSDKDKEYRRLFWSRITLQSYHSTSPPNSEPAYSVKSHKDGSERAIRMVAINQESLPSIPAKHLGNA